MSRLLLHFIVTAQKSCGVLLFAVLLISLVMSTTSFAGESTIKPVFLLSENTEPSSNKAPAISFDDTIPDDLFSPAEPAPEASDLDLSGALHMRTTFQTQQDTAVENNISLRNRLILESKYKNMLTVSAISDYIFFGSEDKTDDYDLDLWEAKWQYTDHHFGVSIGRQIIRWGKTDQISPVDTLNPQDMREFILPEYEDQKIPVWMADLSFFFDKFTLEGVFIPIFEESKIDYFQTNWSVFGHIKKEIDRTALPQALKTYFNDLQVHEKDPETDAEFGLRLTTTIGAADLGLTFHRTNEDTPYFKSFPVKNIRVDGSFSPENLASVLGGAIPTNESIEVEYKRTTIAGFEFETTLGDFGIRGEAAWQENESFLTSSLTSIRTPTVIYIIGSDYTTRGDVYLNLQFVHKHIADYTPEILYFDRNTYTFLGEISRNIISDWLEASLEFSKTMNTNEWYLSPQFKYTYITNLECRIGAGLFAGDTDTWLGRFKDNDLLFFNISYQF
ncbi:DUF1302 family protein [Desulfobacula sp.]|uniref:DUF1302 family protein n=1 Tax=Desulfobacula sp. TaxID=2593537 RepID=UPI00261A45A6|nr:DUF1302 family protein [Desulfobacula sp.]